ncbi:hypothetical protein ACWU4D_02635 [Vibrio sp. WJH972]
MNTSFITRTVLASTYLASFILYAQDLPSIGNYTGSGSVTHGLGQMLVENLFECDRGRARVSPLGEITDTSGKIWNLPADNEFASGLYATDLYNVCNGITPSSLNDVDTNSVPVVEVDSDGEVITGYIFADNYFELYINGQLIGVDSVPFTPFNSSIVKFRVNTPYTIAVKVIDWEEHIGVGTERGRGSNYHPGDGGFIASFSDGTVTSSDWRAQTFYTAPIYDLSCLSETNQTRNSATCSTNGDGEGENAFAVHWEVPKNWKSDTFDDSAWPNATTYTENVIGVRNKNGYMNFREKFTGAKATFIWSSNVVLDNEVLLRYKVE